MCYEENSMIILSLIGGFILFCLFTTFVIDPINDAVEDISSKEDEKRLKEYIEKCLDEYDEI